MHEIVDDKYIGLNNGFQMLNQLYEKSKNVARYVFYLLFFFFFDVSIMSINLLYYAN